MPSIRTTLFSSVVAVLMGAALPAQAADCNNAMTTVEMITCAQQGYDRADAELNRVYKAIRVNMDETARLLLRDA